MFVAGAIQINVYSNLEFSFQYEKTFFNFINTLFFKKY